MTWRLHPDVQKYDVCIVGSYIVGIYSIISYSQTRNFDLQLSIAFPPVMRNNINLTSANWIRFIQRILHLFLLHGCPITLIQCPFLIHIHLIFHGRNSIFIAFFTLYRLVGSACILTTFSWTCGVSTVYNLRRIQKLAPPPPPPPL